jgi:hypothetical protein
MCCVFFYVLCYVLGPLIRLFLQILNYVLPYKCNCIMISNTFNFLLTLKIVRFAGGPCILPYESFSRYLPVARLGNSLQNCKDHCDSHVLPITHAPHFLPEYAVSNSVAILGLFSQYRPLYDEGGISKLFWKVLCVSSFWISALKMGHYIRRYLAFFLQ